MPRVSNAVFLSYASEDAEAAVRIATALRAAGVEVWFDKSELRGGDAWDRQIRDQIRDCRLFVAVISAHTEARDEGYFRREWRLAVERAGDMHEKRAFLVPVVVDGTSERGAAVPEKFREVQWTRLPGGETRSAFVDRIKRLLSPEPQATSKTHISAGTAPTLSSARSARSVQRALLAAVVVAIVGVSTYLAYERPWASKRAVPTAPPSAAPPSATPTAFNPPPHSIAVLPFVNMSGDKEQEYFSDGLTEELLNSLAEINELQVAGRTSSFYFKGKDVDLGTVARKLNVSAILEGSVRRSGHTVRITTQLISTVTGFHLWSHTYDRDLTDVLKLQTEIAGAVASALRVNLLADAAAQIELGGSRNPAAFDAYLRGRSAYIAQHDEKDVQTAIAAYTEAIGFDPNYAIAFANRSRALSQEATWASGPTIRALMAKAQADAQEAIALGPDLVDGRLALALYFEESLDFTRASEEYERALAVAPGNARVLRDYALFAVNMGRTEAGIADARRAVALDPLSRACHYNLGRALYAARRNKEALAALQDALAVDPEDPWSYRLRGFAYYGLGDFDRARASCEMKPDFAIRCLAVTYDKLGRHAEAAAALAKVRATEGDAGAYGYAEIYAQWGNTSKALEWLETALRLRDNGLEGLKVAPLLDPLRNEPRFQAVIRELKFPD
jgi:TolB-like protein